MDGIGSMIPRFVFASVVTLLLGFAGYTGLRWFSGAQPMQRATALIEANRPREAQVVLRPIVRADPRNAEAHVLLARTQLALSDPVAAERELKVARALKYERTVVNPLLAQSYMMQERYADLLTDIPAVAARDDEAVANLVARSAAYVKQGDLVLAQASLDGARALMPGSDEVQLGAFRLAAARGDTDVALKLADATLARSPQNVEAWMLKGEALSRHGQPEEALAAMDAAVKAAPTLVEARQQRVNQYLALGRDADAKADLNVILEIDPRNEAMLLSKALLLLRANNFIDASTELTKLQASFDRHPRGYYWQALAASKLGQNESARDTVTRFLKLQPDDIEGLRLAAQLDLRLGQPERAVASLSTVAGLRDAAAFDVLGRAYFMLGDTSDAVKAFTRASELEPGNREYATHLGAAQVRFGDAPIGSISAVGAAK